MALSCKFLKREMFRQNEIKFFLKRPNLSSALPVEIFYELERLYLGLILLQ